MQCRISCTIEEAENLHITNDDIKAKKVRGFKYINNQQPRKRRLSHDSDSSELAQDPEQAPNKKPANSAEGAPNNDSYCVFFVKVMHVTAVVFFVILLYILYYILN